MGGRAHAAHGVPDVPFRPPASPRSCRPTARGRSGVRSAAPDAPVPGGVCAHSSSADWPARPGCSPAPPHTPRTVIRRPRDLLGSSLIGAVVDGDTAPSAVSRVLQAAAQPLETDRPAQQAPASPRPSSPHPVRVLDPAGRGADGNARRGDQHVRQDRRDTAPVRSTASSGNCPAHSASPADPADTRQLAPVAAPLTRTLCPVTDLLQHAAVSAPVTQSPTSTRRPYDGDAGDDTARPSGPGPALAGPGRRPHGRRPRHRGVRPAPPVSGTRSSPTGTRPPPRPPRRTRSGRTHPAVTDLRLCGCTSGQSAASRPPRRELRRKVALRPSFRLRSRAARWLSTGCAARPMSRSGVTTPRHRPSHLTSDGRRPHRSAPAAP